MLLNIITLMFWSFAFGVAATIATFFIRDVLREGNQ